MLLLLVYRHERGAGFEDIRLERAIRAKLDQPTGPIRRTELLQITQLGAAGKGIRSLAGLEQLIRLEQLDVDDNLISDLTPLRSLNRLARLRARNNRIEHLEPLAHLRSLHRLDLRNNFITNVASLEQLHQLNRLELGGNPIRDASALADLVGLTHLHLRNADIQDFSFLASLMQQGALQDHPDQGIESFVDLRGHANAALDPLRSYWSNIATRLPHHLEAVHLSFTQPSGPLRLNEVMTSNARYARDQGGDTPDWIELHNTGKAPKPLAGWGLSDDPDHPFKWRFPDVSIEPGQFLLVYASGKQHLEGTDELHAGFRLSSGEHLMLTDPAGTLADTVKLPAIPPGTAYGRHANENGSWVYFSAPTPGAPNETPAAHEVLEPPTFSHLGGFYDESVRLHLSHPDPDAMILYTLDGSDPQLAHLDGTTYRYKNSFPYAPGDPFGEFLEGHYQTHVYSQAIDISQVSKQLPDRLARISSKPWVTPTYLPRESVRKGLPVRARAVKPGSIDSVTATHTFFTLPHNHTFHIPVLALTIQEDALFDYDTGIYTPGAHFDAWRRHNPEAYDWRWAGNYAMRGRTQERPCHVELFVAEDAPAAINQPAGVRVHGGTSRSLRLKNLRLYARNYYDGHDRFSYAGLFPKTMRPYGSPREMTEYKRLLLRSHGGGGPYMRDAVSNLLMQPVYEGVNRVQPAVYYINGEFWGITSIRDRFDRYHLALHYDLCPDNIVITYADRLVKTGHPADMDDLREMQRFIIEEDTTDSDVFRIIESMLDLQSYTDYYFINIYLGKWDWGGHSHFGFWRPRVPADTSLGDGRWRAYTWDFDYGPTQQLYRNYLSHALYSFAETGTAMLRSLLENEAYRHYFINRFADHMNTTMHPDRVQQVVEQAYQAIEPYLEASYRRWDFDIGPQEVNDEYVAFAYARPAVQRQHIRDQFGIAGETTVHLDVSDVTGGHIRLNRMCITKETPGVRDPVYPWSGIYFDGIPITLEAVARPGMEFQGWMVTHGETGHAIPDKQTLDPTPSIQIIPGQGDIRATAWFSPF